MKPSPERRCQTLKPNGEVCGAILRNDTYGDHCEDCYAEDKKFFIVNEDRDKNLEAWVRDFLDTTPSKAGWEN